MKDINWLEIQKYYNNNHTWNDIINEFNISNNTIYKATKTGKLKTRTRSEANVVANIKNTKVLSNETKEKISKSRKKYLKEHPDQVPYLLNHYSKGESYPEKYFEYILNKTEIKYKRYVQISYYNIDFAFIEKGIDLEIDGDQHYLDKKIVESNKERDIFLTNNGWKVIRISWSNYKRLKIEERKEYISNLINYIKGSDEKLPNIINNRNYCKCGKEIFKRSKNCTKCTPKKRKVENRPTIETLLQELSLSSYEKVGKKYNVTGNCIKKWLK
jgi:very-short-patch-repair endonuclease